MSRLHWSVCLLALAGCHAAESPANTHITSVSWDANGDPVVHGIVLPAGGGDTDMGSPFAALDPSCDTSQDVVLSDAPLVRDADGASELDPSSNWLCIANPGSEKILPLEMVPYPSGGTWVAHVRAFRSSTQAGEFSADDCRGAFHLYDIGNADACAQEADAVDFFDPSQPVSSCSFGSVSCSSNVLTTCDAYGDTQTTYCFQDGLACSAQSATCCAPPVCGNGGLGAACGSVNNGCGVIDCACRAGLVCSVDRHCERHLNWPPGGS